MKKVTTNITFSQIMFILLVFFLSALMFFYLGAKFGPKIMNTAGSSLDDPILPDEQLSLEIEQLLKTKKHDFVFQEALESKKQLEVLQPVNQDVQTFNTNEIVQDHIDESKKETAVEQTEIKVIKEKNKMNVKVGEPIIIDATVQANEGLGIKLEERTALQETQGQKYRLQLGSYSKKKMALDAKALWKKRGYDVSVVKSSIRGKGKWYRLNIGFYPDLDSVKNMQMKITTKYQESSKIVAVE